MNGARPTGVLLDVLPFEWPLFLQDFAQLRGEVNELKAESLKRGRSISNRASPYGVGDRGEGAQPSGTPTGPSSARLTCSNCERRGFATPGQGPHKTGDCAGSWVLTCRACTGMGFSGDQATHREKTCKIAQEAAKKKRAAK